MSKKQKRILIRILIAAALTAGAWLAPLDGVWKAAAFAAPYLVIGCDVLWVLCATSCTDRCSTRCF